MRIIQACKLCKPILHYIFVSGGEMWTGQLYELSGRCRLARVKLSRLHCILRHVYHLLQYIGGIWQTVTINKCFRKNILLPPAKEQVGKCITHVYISVCLCFQLITFEQIDLGHHNIWVKFEYQGHRSKAKIIAVKKLKNSVSSW